MSFTIKNLRADIVDRAPDFGNAPDFEVRFARDPLGCERSGLSFQRLAAGARHPYPHRHGEAEEVYVVVAGAGRLLLDGVPHAVRQWDAIRVSPETVRAFEAGPDGIEFLAFGPHGVADAEVMPVEWPG